MLIFLDIETLPDLRSGALDAIRATIRPPAQFKKPESIAEWLKENGEAEAEKAWRKTALDGTSGELCAIGYAVEDEPAEVLVRHHSSEADLLRRFFVRLQREMADRNAHGAAVRWAGFNIQGFDLPFLWKRAVIHQVEPPVNLRPDRRNIEDVMGQWAGYGQFASLDAVCRALNLPSPKQDGMDGGQVYELWRTGRVDELAAYCQRDVEAVRECWKRLNFTDTVGWTRPPREDAA